MNYKTFFRIFLFATASLLISILTFTLLIDPYDVTGINILNIKHKLTRDGRLQKINRIKELKSIDNLILGSSRSERLNPTTVSQLLGGYTYTFGIGGAGIEDALGLLLYLEKEQKSPKNIILCVDFVSFAEGKPSEGFYKIPELNFLNSQNTNQNYAAKLFSIDALRASIKTFEIHLKHIEPNSYIDQNGFLKSEEITPSGDMESIRKVADYYYNFNYRKGDVQFSKERFEYLKRIVAMSNKHHVKLYIMLTPEHAQLYKMIENNSKLLHKMNDVKQKLLAIAPYYDAMVLNEKTTNPANFEDAVHYNEKMGDLLLNELLKHQ